MLGEISSWDEFDLIAKQLEKDNIVVSQDHAGLTAPLATLVDELLDISKNTINTVASVYKALGRDDLERIERSVAGTMRTVKVQNSAHFHESFVLLTIVQLYL